MMNVMSYNVVLVAGVLQAEWYPPTLKGPVRSLTTELLASKVEPLHRAMAGRTQAVSRIAILGALVP